MLQNTQLSQRAPPLDTQNVLLRSYPAEIQRKKNKAGNQKRKKQLAICQREDTQEEEWKESGGTQRQTERQTAREMHTDTADMKIKYRSRDRQIDTDINI